MNAIRLTDVGSFPLDADLNRYLRGALELEMNSGGIETDDTLYFMKKHNETFIRKSKALGPEDSVTSYAQCRGMISQFLLPEMFHAKGITDFLNDDTIGISDISKQDSQTLAAAIAIGKVPFSHEKSIFPEVLALQHGAKKICEELGVERISYKACITGPLELSLNLQRLADFPRTYDEKLMEFFTDVVKGHANSAIINSKHLNTEIVTLDEPTIGFEGLGDFFTDSSSDPNLDHLISCWNRIYGEIPTNIYRGIHLHRSPFEALFKTEWNLIEAHVGVYVKRQWLEEYDKFVRAAVVRTDGPTIDESADVKASWQDIYSGNYKSYLQPAPEMEKHLQQTIDIYGAERIPFAGPECGFGPWDWKHGPEMAIETLEKLKIVIREYNQET
jgi:methionine synthase II (cobalamin-independent)